MTLLRTTFNAETSGGMVLMMN